MIFLGKFMTNKICAIVVTYNREKLLKQCIGFLLAQTISCDILIIDNASTDNTAEVVKEFTDSRISYCNTGENIGGAGGFNLGMRKAVEAGYDYVWVMDDDTFARPDTLEQFLIADQKLNGNYGWLSSKALWTDGSICAMNCQTGISGKDITDFSQEHIPSSRATFVSLFIKNKTIVKYGLPIKEFFVWADDTEFTQRVSKKENCYVISKSVVVHAMTANAAADIVHVDVSRIPRCYYQIRNHCYISRTKDKNFGTAKYLYRQVKNVLKIILFSKDFRWKRLNVLLHSVVAGVFFCPSVEYVQKDK